MAQSRSTAGIVHACFTDQETEGRAGATCPSAHSQRGRTGIHTARSRAPALTSLPAGDNFSPPQAAPRPTPPPPVKESSFQVFRESASEKVDSSFPPAARGLPSGGAGTEAEKLGSSPGSALEGSRQLTSIGKHISAPAAREGSGAGERRKHRSSRSLTARSKSKRRQGPAGSALGTGPQGAGG